MLRHILSSLQRDIGDAGKGAKGLQCLLTLSKAGLRTLNQGHSCAAPGTQHECIKESQSERIHLSQLSRHSLKH